MSDDRVMAALARIEGDLARLEVNQANLERELARLSAETAARLDVLEHRLTAVRADVELNMSRTDQAGDLAEHGRHEFGHLWRMIQRLQVRLDRAESKPDSLSH